MVAIADLLTDLSDLNLIGPDNLHGIHCLDCCFRIMLVNPCFIPCDDLTEKVAFIWFNFDQNCC